MRSPRQTITETVFDLTKMVGHARSAVAWVLDLQMMLDAVPSQHRDNVVLELYGDALGFGIDTAKATYSRPETDAEWKSRVEERVIAADREMADRKARDFTEYRRLKAIFEPAPADTVAQL